MIGLACAAAGPEDAPTIGKTSQHVSHSFILADDLGYTDVSCMVRQKFLFKTPVFEPHCCTRLPFSASLR